MDATIPTDPTHTTEHRARRRVGSVVTWATVILMVAGLFVYLVFGYFAAE